MLYIHNSEHVSSSAFGDLDWDWRRNGMRLHKQIKHSTPFSILVGE